MLLVIPQVSLVIYNSHMFYILNLHFVCPTGKPMIHHRRCCQGFAIYGYGFTLDAEALAYFQLSLNYG